MIKVWYVIGLVFCCAALPAATVTVSPWVPIFKGVDLASGQQQATVAGEPNHRTMCMRIDLTDPSIELFTTPKCTNCGTYETLAENTSRFLESHGMQVAVNGGFYSSSLGPNDVPLGTPEDVLGLAISRSEVVSTANNPVYAATFLFTEDNQAFYVPTNSPPTNTAGIYTAISGSRALLINGVNVQAPNPSDLDPRTAFGLSQDHRYLYLMTLDGRQLGWSDGADFYNTGEWLLRFGAWDGINVDGGGSTTMVMADCSGGAVRLNRSSFVAAYGRERIIGHNFGVRALPLAAEKTATVSPGTTTALITWQTGFPANTRVEYGFTTNYGSATPLDSRRTTNHVATLTGLVQGSNYYYRAVSEGETETFSAACRFTTLRPLSVSEIFPLTKSWTYTTNNLDGVNWKAASYNDSGWMGQGPGLLHVLETSIGVAPKNTVMPPLTTGLGIPRTYYFRTHFDFTGDKSAVSLIFSNYVDDGAVFYLNGTEIYRLRMANPPAVITAISNATGVPCMGSPQSGDALTICPDVFSVSGGALVQGDNVLAVEVHNYITSSDLVFGTALLKNTVETQPPLLQMFVEDNVVTLFWNGAGFVLQESSDIGLLPSWTDVPGPVTVSPYSVTNGTSTFYRLRN
jgi:hypothetical protein